MNQLPNDFPYIDRCRHLGIMGQDPLLCSSKEEGEQLTDLFVDRLTNLIETVWETKDQNPILKMHKEYEQYISQLQNIKTLDKTIQHLGMQDKKDFLRHGKWLILQKARYIPKQD